MVRQRRAILFKLTTTRSLLFLLVALNLGIDFVLLRCGDFLDCLFDFVLGLRGLCVCYGFDFGRDRGRGTVRFAIRFERSGDLLLNCRHSLFRYSILFATEREGDSQYYHG